MTEPQTDRRNCLRQVCIGIVDYALDDRCHSFFPYSASLVEVKCIAFVVGEHILTGHDIFGKINIGIDAACGFDECIYVTGQFMGILHLCRILENSLKNRHRVERRQVT